MASPISLKYNATLVGRVDMTNTLAIFRVQQDTAFENEDAGPAFEPGQYAVLGLNNEADLSKGYVRRAYSIASPPSETRWMEFYIRYVNQPTSNNPLTHLLWDLRVGDRIWVGSKIVGKFTLANTVGRDDPRLKVFVAAGTGLAPFVSMVRQIANHLPDNAPLPDDLIILHGASHPHDMGYQEDLEMMMNQLKRQYFQTVSRPHLHPDWSGDTGRVETFFDAEKLVDLEARLGREPGFLTPETSVVFVCGLQGTIAQTLIRLFRRGFVPNDRKIRQALKLPDHLAPSLFFEQYDTLPILDLQDDRLLNSIRESMPDGF